MIFANPAAPVINMGGLHRFELSQRASAPAVLDRIVAHSTQDPSAQLPPDLTVSLARLLAACLGDGGRHFRRAAFLILRYPALVGEALRAFLEDPLRASGDQPEGESAARDQDGSQGIAPVVAMRAAWLAEGGDPAVFDRLTLWEHGRILRERSQAKRQELANMAVAARSAQAKPEAFRKFVRDLNRDPAERGRNAWVQGLFAAAANVPTITQADLARMKGNPDE